MPAGRACWSSRERVEKAKKQANQKNYRYIKWVIVTGTSTERAIWEKRTLFFNGLEKFF